MNPFSKPGEAGFIVRAFLVLTGLVLFVVAGVLAYVQLAPLPRYAVTAAPLKVEVTPERVARGKLIATMRCFDCHFDPETRSATGIRILDIPAPVAPATFAANITGDPKAGIGAMTDGQLAYLLRTGINPEGRLLAPWMPRAVHLADEDLYDLIAFLRSDDPALKPNPTPTRPTQYGLLGKALQRLVWKPESAPKGPIVAPPLSDKVAYGKYIVQGYMDCYACHSADFAKVNNATPELSPGYLGGGNKMADAVGETVYSANITPDPETGIGRWSEQDFIRAIREGVRPDHTPLRSPMPHFLGLREEQAAAVYAYLKTVPPLRNIPPKVAAQ